VKRLALNIVAAGTALMPNRLKRLRISAVAVLVTPAVASDTLRMTVRDGGGNIAAQFEVATLVVVGQAPQRLAVNGPGNIAQAFGGLPETPSYLPPDLWIETEDSVEFSFVSVPTSVDSPIVITYEEE